MYLLTRRTKSSPWSPKQVSMTQKDHQFITNQVSFLASRASSGDSDKYWKRIHDP